MSILTAFCLIYTTKTCNLKLGFVTDLTGGNKNYSGQIQAAENIAILEINNNTDLLPNCTITTTIIDSKSKSSEVVKGGLTLVGQNGNDPSKSINVPFVMGAQLSSLSSYLNPILSTFDVLQIAASATSVSLSPLEYFHRVVPADTLQAQGLLELCKLYGWTNVGVLYVNDAYGIYLFSGISTEASQISGFSVTGVSFETGNMESIRAGVEGIRKSGVWV